MDDRQSLFWRLNRPKLQEFDEISEIPEIMEESVFVGMNKNNQNISKKIKVSQKKMTRTNRRLSLGPDMSGLQLDSKNRVNTLEERSIRAEVALRSGRDLAMKGKGKERTSSIESEEDSDWTPSKKGKKDKKTLSKKK